MIKYRTASASSKTAGNLIILLHIKAKFKNDIKSPFTNDQICLQDSNSEFKDSGIEGPEVEAELDSLPSSGVSNVIIIISNNSIISIIIIIIIISSVAKK